jgi:hypothetical protein
MSSCAYLVYLLYLVIVVEVEIGLEPDLLVLQVLQ